MAESTLAVLALSFSFIVAFLVSVGGLTPARSEETGEMTLPTGRQRQALAVLAVLLAIALARAHLAL
jgi:hypothetical protein